jgi:hypothetical protein
VISCQLHRRSNQDGNNSDCLVEECLWTAEDHTASSSWNDSGMETASGIGIQGSLLLTSSTNIGSGTMCVDWVGEAAE